MSTSRVAAVIVVVVVVVFVEFTAEAYYALSRRTHARVFTRARDPDR